MKPASGVGGNMGRGKGIYRVFPKCFLFNENFKFNSDINWTEVHIEHIKVKINLNYITLVRTAQ